MVVLFFFFKQKTAYELRISDWSSDVCSSDLFGLRGPLGEFLAEQLGVVFAFRWTGAALASAVMGFPLMVRAVRLSIEAVDRRLEDAAGTLGASPAWVFLTVTLPLIVPGDRKSTRLNSQSLMRISYAAFCLTKTKKTN